ncbi:MAG: flagellar export chaperone FliS [Gemmatimonadota bacterium]|nr:flagellar export chaperone FliS [Gemmatimonadota bacterium]
MNRRSIDRYNQVEVLTLSAPRRLVLVYSHLLATLRLSRYQLNAREFEPLGKSLCKAQDIVNELLVTLDRDAGGALAENLVSLYAWFLAEIVAIGVRGDVARLDHLIRLVGELHQAWDQAATEVLAGEAVANPA